MNVNFMIHSHINGEILISFSIHNFVTFEWFQFYCVRHTHFDKWTKLYKNVRSRAKRLFVHIRITKIKSYVWKANRMLLNNEFDNNFRLECKRWVKSTKGKTEMRSKLMSCKRHQIIIIMKNFKNFIQYALHSTLAFNGGKSGNFVIKNLSLTRFQWKLISRQRLSLLLNEILFDFWYIILGILCTS